MAFTIYVRMKKAGRQKKEELKPVPFLLEKRPGTAKELLISLTRLGVREYNERKDDGQILGWLTREQIREKASEGKVSFGLRGGNDADPEKSAANTLQCFEDGIFRVFAGDEELTGLEQRIPWDKEEHLIFTFIRLTMLSGW